MNDITSGSRDHTPYQLRFRSLRHADVAVAFPCDEAGHVDLDALSAPDRNDYFFARTVIGCDFSSPTVVHIG
ncbi:MAG TPA: hypothetical protein VFP68_02830 [Burkholderiaceae bacterium]|nr:hypothetical protein [Burkholderiaceae bacterium]